MKKLFLALALIFSVVSINASVEAQKDDQAAREIMQKVEERDNGDNMTAKMEMILIDRKNKERVRNLQIYRKDKGEDTYSLMFFIHPAEVKDTGFLIYDYDDPKKDDDQWLYLPALKKTKRIATGDKSGSFMGSDLNYSDMTTRDLDDFDFIFYKEKETEIDGRKCWLILATPRSEKVVDETGYRQSVLYIRQDNYFVIRSIMWEEQEDYKKFMEVKKLDLIDGIWISSELYVYRKKSDMITHKTVLRFKDVKFNRDLKFDLFSLRRLEKGF